MAFETEIIVDLWKTGAHKVEMGVKKDLEHRSKSRQFTKDSDIIGEVNQDSKDAGYVSYRTEPWKLEIPNQRIVLKYFTEGMNWKASMEELVSKGIAKSLSAQRGMPVFMINLQESEYLVTLEKVQRDKSFGKSIYAFTIVDEKNRGLYPFSIEADRMTLGSDWDVFDRHREKIAKIDGSKFNIGGKYTIKLDKKSQNYRKELPEVLVLFSTLNRFLEDVEKKLDKTRKKFKDDKLEMIVESEEAMLYLNPRRIKT